jgi:vitamin B12 transport system substrate-binding protein
MFVASGGIAKATTLSKLNNEPIDKQQLRIIALAPHIVESLFEIGAGKQIVGTTAHADYPVAAKAIPVVGNASNLQIERIIELRPDIVISWQSGNPVQDIARLKKYGISVVYSNPSKLEDVASELRLYGALTGRVKEAEERAIAYETKLQNLKKTFANLSPISVFYELWPQPLRTIANKAWPQQQLEVCGATNPFQHANQDYPLIAIEQVLKALPQVIIQPLQNGERLPAHAIEWGKWPALPAVANQQIVHPNADKAHRMTSRMLDELAVLCESLDAARASYPFIR